MQRKYPTHFYFFQIQLLRLLAFNLHGYLRCRVFGKWYLFSFHMRAIAAIFVKVKTFLLTVSCPLFRQFIRRRWQWVWQRLDQLVLWPRRPRVLCGSRRGIHPWQFQLAWLARKNTFVQVSINIFFFPNRCIVRLCRWSWVQKARIQKILMIKSKFIFKLTIVSFLEIY